MRGRHLTHPAARSAALGLFGLAVAGLACGGGDDGGPPVITSVTVTSPTVGNRMARGRTAQLVAVALDARGNVITEATFTWSSSRPGVADVKPGGVVTGVSAGDAMISAMADGVTGSVLLEVRDVDLAGIGAAVSDPFTAALAANLTGPVRGPVQAALAQCAAGVTQGNLTTIESCFASARAPVTGATDDTDRVLLASLALFLDHIERLLSA